MRTMISRPGTLFAVGAALAVAACTSAGAPGASSSPASSAVVVAASAPTGGVSTSAAAVPAPVAESGGGTVTAGAAIAYPYPVYAGTPGLAPDHTIVVSGTGQSAEASDGSDHAAAEHRALVAALADAKAQADTVAATTHVTISGVLSVAVNNSMTYGGPIPLPAAGAATGGPEQPVPAPTEPTPSLEVVVTVQYSIS
jgi:hypothetical protein